MGRKIRKLKKAFIKISEVIGKKTSSRINIGFVGCGVHASQSLYPCLRYLSVNLIATCAKHLESAQRTARFFGAERAYDNYQEMFKKEKLDAILVSIGPRFHYEIALEAMKRGLHIFVEKPPAESSRQALEMLETSKKSGRYLMVGFNRRFAPAFTEAKRIISSPSFEDPHLMLANFFVGETKAEWDLILDIGIHYFDLARFFFGEVKEVSALRVGSKKVGSKNLSTLAIVLKFINKKIAIISLSNRYLWAKPNEWVTILGDECQVTVDNIQTLIFRKPTIVSPGEIPKENEKTTIWQPNYSVGSEKNNPLFLNGYAYELAHFFNVVSGKEKPLSGIYEGYEALKIAEKIRKILKK